MMWGVKGTDGVHNTTDPPGWSVSSCVGGEIQSSINYKTV